MFFAKCPRLFADLLTKKEIVTLLYESHGMQNYLPEKRHLEGKQNRSSRVLRERIAVFSAGADSRLMASYGLNASAGQTLFQVFDFEREERDFLESSLKSRRRVLAACAEGSLLVFGDWMADTGLLLVLHLPEPKSLLARVFALMGRGEIAVSPGEEPPHAKGFAPDDAIEHLAELFYYLDRIFSPSAEIGLPTRAALIAELIGCRIDRDALPAAISELPSENQGGLTAFLFCALLTLRNENVSLASVGNLRCSLSYTEGSIGKKETATSEKNEAFAWTRHPGFAPFEILIEGNTVSVRADARSHEVVGRFHAETSTRILELSISLDWQSAS